MPFDVQLTAGAALDLEDIYDDISERHSSAEADYVLERIKRVSSGLSEHPHRGSYPKELLDLAFATTAKSSSSPTASSTAWSRATSTCC